MGRRRRKKDEENPLHHPARPERAEHLTGEVDEWQAQLEQGAGGLDSEVSDAELEAQAAAAVPSQDVREELEADEIDDIPGQKPRVRAADKASSPGGQPTKAGGFRLFQFFKASWAELQRVQWPDRRQVAQATAVVLGFVVIAGAYLGLADAAAQRVIDFIL